MVVDRYLKGTSDIWIGKKPLGKYIERQLSRNTYDSDQIIFNVYYTNIEFSKEKCAFSRKCNLLTLCFLHILSHSELFGTNIELVVYGIVL